MARSVTAARSAVGSRSARRKTSHRRHHKKDDIPQPDRPDISELRRLREAFFGQSEKARPATKVKHGSLSHKSDGKRKAGPSRKEADRTTEYVYATSRRGSQSSSGHGRHISDRSPRSNDGMSTILEHEVTPNDSISQVGGRRRRKKPMRTTMQSVAEKSESAVSKPRRDSLFSSFFSKRSSSSATATATATAKPPRLVDCLTCGADDIPIRKSAKLACDHRMCHSCLRRVFKLAVQDPAHMPPKCCTDQPIPLKYVDRLFDERFKILFNRKLDENRTRDRTYCPNRRCGVWIRPAYYRSSAGRRYAQCNRCNTKACLLCGMKLHKSNDCPKDPEIAKLVEQAEERGWQRCYKCQAMVELREGCNHMTCRCTAQFCMLCGAKWKSCDCPWFSQGALPVFDRDDRLPDPFAFIQLFGRQAPRPARGFQEEIDRRRRQEQEDEALARRLQNITIWD